MLKSLVSMLFYDLISKIWTGSDQQAPSAKPPGKFPSVIFCIKLILRLLLIPVLPLPSLMGKKEWNRAILMH